VHNLLLRSSAGPKPHSHLECGGCQTLLMYPQGAGNVRCSRCSHVTPAPPASSTEASQIVCNGCRVLLSYPKGAQSVQCSMCHTITEVSDDTAVVKHTRKGGWRRVHKAHDVYHIYAVDIFLDGSGQHMMCSYQHANKVAATFD